jgi:hypothetical protein
LASGTAAPAAAAASCKPHTEADKLLRQLRDAQVTIASLQARVSDQDAGARPLSRPFTPGSASVVSAARSGRPTSSEGLMALLSGAGAAACAVAEVEVEADAEELHAQVG